MTVDPEIPVPPWHYGGIERIVFMLVEELTRRGHQIHLFAHPDSKVPGRLVPFQGRMSRSLLDTIRNGMQIREYIRRTKGIDLIHSFSRLAYLLPLMKSDIPKIQSYQRHITPRSVFLGSLLAGRGLTFSACSKFCADTVCSRGGRWVIIPNGVSLSKYLVCLKVADDASLIFLGRVERIKGTHTAIEVSKRAGRNLIIAGNHAPEGPEWRYFSEEILPHCDGRRIRYVGPVDDAEKSKLLGRSAALLFPIEWDEPFGIVMAEALACGTPVLAFGRGAVPEVIEHGITGFICRDADDMVEAVKDLARIDRASCRKVAEASFSSEVIVEKYEQLYYSCVSALDS